MLKLYRKLKYLCRSRVRASSKRTCRKTAEEVFAEEDASGLLIGTMIELPRACLTADEIANSADFFSFGTNDLTQTTFGFSRDDAEGKILPHYVEQKILSDSPFIILDRKGVGSLMRMAVEKGRGINPIFWSVFVESTAGNRVLWNFAT